MAAYPDTYYGAQPAAGRSGAHKSQRGSSYRGELERFIAHIPQGGSVLDVGCGEGRTLARIRRLRPDVQLFGIDHSEVEALLPEGTQFTQGSVEELAKHYKPGSFDAVFCQHVIEHLHLPLNLVSGIHAVLRPGGRVYLETPNWTRLVAPFSFLYFWNDYTHVHPYTRFALHRLFLEFGFSVDMVRSLSTCSWRRSGVGGVSEGGNSKKEKASAFAHTHATRGFFAKALAYAVNPLLRDLLVAVATKQ